MSLYKKLLREDESGLIQENDDGYIEYKWRLDLKNINNLKKLVSQLLWRLNEGKEIVGMYEAHYVLGVYDDGSFGKLSKDELDISINIFKNIVQKASAEISSSEIFQFGSSHMFYCVVKLKPYDKKIEEINVMVCGGEQVGKTTLISHLCYSVKDDGNGKIRDLIITHDHEKHTGNTTSIHKEIIGVKNNKLINYDHTHNWEEIAKTSDKIINIYDTPGNKKYFKNVLKALQTYMIDIILIVYDDNINLELDSYERFLIKYAEKLNIKHYLINSKVEDKNKVKNINNDTLLISNINPELSDIDKLKNILINSTQINNYNSINKIKLENVFRVNAVYNIPDRNKIIAGIQVNGTISCDSLLYVIFPDLSLTKIKIQSIFKKNIESKNLYYKETGSIGFSLINENHKEICKDCIITTFDTYQYIINNNIFKHNKLNIIIGENNINLIVKYHLINSNINYNVQIKSYINNEIELDLPNNVLIQDEICILVPIIDKLCYENIIIAKFI
jgi:signal recognition particle receptor subunit beta